MKRARPSSFASASFAPNNAFEQRAMSSDGVIASQETPLQYKELTFTSQDSTLDFGAIDIRAEDSTIDTGIQNTLNLEKFNVKQITIPYSWFDIPDNSRFIFSVNYDGLTYFFDIPISAQSFASAGNSDAYNQAGEADAAYAMVGNGLAAYLNRRMKLLPDGAFITGSPRNGHWFFHSSTMRLTFAIYQLVTVVPPTQVIIQDTAFARYLGFSSDQLGVALTLPQLNGVASTPHYAFSSTSGLWYKGLQARYSFSPCPYACILVKCPELSSSVLHTGARSGHNVSGVIAEVPINGIYGDQLVFQPSLLDNNTFITHGAKLNKIRFELSFPNSMPISLNGLPWSITLGVWYRRDIYADHY